MKNEIRVLIPIPESKNVRVQIIGAQINEDSLEFIVEDAYFRVGYGEFEPFATDDNHTAKLLESALGSIKPVKPEALLGKEIIVDIVHDYVYGEKIAFVDEVRSSENTEENVERIRVCL